MTQTHLKLKVDSYRQNNNEEMKERIKTLWPWLEIVQLN